MNKWISPVLNAIWKKWIAHIVLCALAICQFFAARYAAVQSNGEVTVESFTFISVGIVTLLLGIFATRLSELVAKHQFGVAYSIAIPIFAVGASVTFSDDLINILAGIFICLVMIIPMSVEVMASRTRTRMMGD